MEAKILFLKNSFIYFTLQYCIGFAIHWLESTTSVHVFPILNPLPPSSPSHPSGSSQYTSPKHPVSCFERRLAICFTSDILHVSMPFSHIIPLSTSPTESKRLFYTSVSLLLSCIQGYCYHLSKFHIYALVYCIGVFLSNCFLLERSDFSSFQDIKWWDATHPHYGKQSALLEVHQFKC